MTKSDRDALRVLCDETVADHCFVDVRKDQALELLDRVEQLEAENEAQASQLLDPDATCCADATRVTRALRLKLEGERDSALVALEQCRAERDEAVKMIRESRNSGAHLSLIDQTERQTAETIAVMLDEEAERVREFHDGENGAFFRAMTECAEGWAKVIRARAWKPAPQQGADK